MIGFCIRCIACTVLFASLAPAQVGHSLIRIPEQTKKEIANRQTAVRATLTRVAPAVVHVWVKIHGLFPFPIFRDSCGVTISPDGMVLTNWHLVKEAKNEGAKRAKMTAMVRCADGIDRDASILAFSKQYDLALLKIDLDKDQKLPFAELGDSDTILPGEIVLTSGRPDEKKKMFGTFIGSADRAQTGIRIGLHDVKARELLLSDANLKLFVDGGPVFDINGRVLATINSSMVRKPLTKDSSDAERLAHKNSFGFAIRSNVAKRVFHKHLGGLGVTPETMAERAARRAGMAGVIANCKSAIVSVRQASLKKMPKPDRRDPYGKFPKQWLGSGVVVHPIGLVLTNAFVAGDEGVIVTTTSGKVYKGSVVASLDVSPVKPDMAKGKFVAKDSRNFALVKVDVPKGETLPFMELANSTTANLGERVAALGNRYGHTVSVKLGVLSSKPRSKDVGSQHASSMGHFQTDANINNGNTGGALINLVGQLIGINDVRAAVDKPDEKAGHEAKAALTDTTIGFAVPADWIRQKLAKEIGKFVGDSAANKSLIAAPVVTDAQRKTRESKVTKVVAKYADCFLNVFVKHAKIDKKDGGLMADLFPESADDKDFHLLGQGSGVIIDPTGLALTNWHVVDAATYKDGAARKDFKVFVSLGNGKTYEVQVLSTSRIDDLALLQLRLEPGERMAAIRLGDSDAIDVGETVVAVGNPHGFANSVTVGLVTAKNRDIGIRGRARLFRGLIQTDAAINPGNSGGALIDLNGFLVGINSAGNMTEAKHGFAIPVNYVRKKFHETLLSSDKLRNVFTGIRTEDRTDGGTFVKAIEDICPGVDAGVKIGDQIVRVKGAKLTDGLMWVKIVGSSRPFDPLPITVLRDGKKIDLVIEPASDAAWAIFRRAGFAVKEVDYGTAGKALEAAGIAAYREFARDPKGMPSDHKETGLIVTHVRPAAVRAGMDMKPGDIIVGRRVLVREIHLPDRHVLEHIDTVKVLRDIIRKSATKDGTKVEFWTVRGEKVLKPQALVKKVKPRN